MEIRRPDDVLLTLLRTLQENIHRSTAPTTTTTTTTSSSSSSSSSSFAARHKKSTYIGYSVVLQLLRQLWLHERRNDGVVLANEVTRSAKRYLCVLDEHYLYDVDINTFSISCYFMLFHVISCYFMLVNTQQVMSTAG